MKTVVLALLVIAQMALAGNGSGTLGMDPKMAKLIASRKNPGIVLYQGESSKNIYFQYGRAQNNQWKLDKYYAEKSNLNLDSKITEAIIKSKLSEDWEKIEKINQSNRSEAIKQ